MTIGLIALRAAKEQLAAAIATIKDELANPEICEQIKFEVYNIGSDLDDHLTELGKAMPALGSAQAAADTQEAKIAEGEPSTAGNAALDEPGANESPSAADLDATVAAVAEGAPGPEVLTFDAPLPG
jgi:hypothetical protein